MGLKKEAVPFFADKLATRIYDWDFWKEHNVDEKALEKVEEQHIEYGIRTSETGSDLGGWDKNGTRLCFTIVFPSITFYENNRFTKDKVVREMMNRLQGEVNRYMCNFLQEDGKQ